MHKRHRAKTVIYLYAAFVLLLVGTVFAAALYSTHLSTITLPDGQEVASNWPQQYADSFGGHIQYPDGEPEIDDAVLPYLQKNRIWVQFLGPDGMEISDYGKPAELPSGYSLRELFDLAAYNQLGGYTAVFVASEQESSMGYIVGFPVAVTKTILYLNGDRYIGGRDSLYAALTGLCVFIVLAGLFYSTWLTRHVSRIVKSTNDIAARDYTPQQRKGVFGDAYGSLDKLNTEIAASDSAHAETDRMRSEWIVNITHDLKTPLSPIKGYAELLSDGRYSASEIPKYGEIIAKNAAYTERLINDLKLTYQMDSGQVPVRLQPVNLAREIKERVIDLLNNPDYVNRQIAFTSETEPLQAAVDMPLFQRAVTNILVNALTHNPPETTIRVSLKEGEEIELTISDDGKGLSEEEVRHLFTRYYRGVRSDERPEGSGLGLAIAKQIIELHHGTIAVQSERDSGTTVTIRIPKTNAN